MYTIIWVVFLVPRTPQDSSLQNEVRYAFMIGNLHVHNIKNPLVYISV